jgi:hypothetical protein
MSRRKYWLTVSGPEIGGSLVRLHSLFICRQRAERSI